MFNSLHDLIEIAVRKRMAFPKTLGVLPPDEPIYTIPPEEMQPEISVMAELVGLLANDQRDWGHQNLGIEALHNQGITGSGVVVCIADTGVDYTHPDLKDRMILDFCKDFTGSSSGFMDRQGHGTHCSGIATASSNDAGIIGAAPSARLFSSKVLSDQGSGASSWIAAGIRHAAAKGADIISLSLGGPSPDSATRLAIQEATADGVWVVCAAGNDGRTTNSYPGHYQESIAVCATDKNDQRASFSTLNQENDTSAPGVSILSTLPGGRYGTMSGTSMATPYVAGCLALVRGALKASRKAIPKQKDLIQAIYQTSKDIAPPGRDTGTGAGLINVAGLIKLLVGTTPPAPPPTDPNPPPTDPGEPGAYERTFTVRSASPITFVVR